MEREQVAALLEKYWQVETTVEEEKMLAEYFRVLMFLGMAVYRDIFSFYEQESDVKPPEGLEERIMEQVQPRRKLHGAWWAAAAVIVMGLGISRLQREIPVQRTASQIVKDTYADPQQALAAVQKALLIASRNMNKGLQPLK